MIENNKLQTAQEAEMLALSDDFYGVEELEERLELASGVVDIVSTCTANYCGLNHCSNNTNTGW